MTTIIVTSQFLLRGLKTKRDESYVKIRSYKKLDDEEVLGVLLGRQDIWKEVLELESIDDIVCCVTEILAGVLDILCPAKWIRASTKHPGWLNSAELRSLRYMKAAAHRKAVSLNSLDSWASYRRIRNHCTRRFRSFKAQYLSNLASHPTNSRMFWKELSFLQSSSKASTTYTHTALEFDQYFTSIPYVTIKDIPGYTACPTDYLSFSDIPPFQFKPITEESVIKEIASLNSHKAAGHDSLPSILVKKVRLFISTPIAHNIINRSFEEGIFPDYWKRSIIIPIQKKKGCTELRNFRPISILPVLSKVIERVGQEQIIDYLLENNLITPFQSGFRAGFSTQDVLLRVTNSWVKAVDERKYVGTVFLDIAKAFDCIDHSILVEKLRYYGIVGRPLDWFKDYLFNRQKSIRIGRDTSDWSPVSIGVPQGSILGPLLFLLYINDLSSVVRYSEINIYADDTELHYCSKDLVDLHTKLQADLDEIGDWLTCNHLRGNADKSVSMLVGSKRKVKDLSLKLSLNNRQLECVERTKYLGLLIDRFLTWEDHVLSIIQSSRSKIYALNRLKPLPKRLLIRLYKAYVYPLFDYSSIVYHSCSVVISRKLDKFHLHALKTLGLSDTLLTLPSIRREYFISVQSYKIFYKLCPS